ncbi:MAG: aldolase/citrate lyase family protein [Candidatus Endonucleobacter sp. (ex Gigantidas childressi)]|nr:aldolase/citrate lyase family protein [Candidatus Endonucleobacter sp. (ex Gigantidas childressi)]
MKTMIIDNNIENIRVYDEAGVDRVFIDLEVNGKQNRQGDLNTVISCHSLDDIKKIKSILNQAELLVRVNPIYRDSATEIMKSIDNGADVIMLPMFKTVNEVKLFVDYVNKKATTCLLLETSQALARLDCILEIDGIDEIHIGLNDLHLAMGLDFMFELMGDGLVEYISHKIKAKNIPFGIGGVARMDEGVLKGNIVIKEHVRLGSSMVILSRTFKRDLEIDKTIFKKEILKLQEVEMEAKKLSHNALEENKLLLQKLAEDMATTMRKKKQHV